MESKKLKVQSTDHGTTKFVHFGGKSGGKLKRPLAHVFRRLTGKAEALSAFKSYSKDS